MYTRTRVVYTAARRPYARTHTPKPHEAAPIFDVLEGEEHDQVEFDQLRVVFLAQQVVQVQWDNVRPNLSFDEALRTVLHLMSFTIAVLYDSMLFAEMVISRPASCCTTRCSSLKW